MKKYIVKDKEYTCSEYEELLVKCCDRMAGIDGDYCIGDCKKCLECFIEKIKK